LKAAQKIDVNSTFITTVNARAVHMSQQQYVQQPARLGRLCSCKEIVKEMALRETINGSFVCFESPGRQKEMVLV
jgi:hypothetical protein